MHVHVHVLDAEPLAMILKATDLGPLTFTRHPLAVCFMMIMNKCIEQLLNIIHNTTGSILIVSVTVLTNN